MNRRRAAQTPSGRVLLSRVGQGSAADGFIMLEVLAAVAMLSLFLVTVTASMERAVASAGKVRDELAAVSSPKTDARAVDPWSWGLQVLDGYWEAGPVLYLKTPRFVGLTPEHGMHEAFLGLWIDGWQVTQTVFSADDLTTVRLDAPLWAGREGREVVVRLRAVDQGWGPPWRSVVPCLADRETGQPGTDHPAGEVGVVVVHSVSLGTSGPAVTAAGAAVIVSSQGPPAVFEKEAQGLWESSLAGCWQTWRGEAGRKLDVYY